jgi:hypothetical protein
MAPLPKPRFSAVIAERQFRKTSPFEQPPTMDQRFDKRELGSS